MLASPCRHQHLTGLQTAATCVDPVSTCGGFPALDSSLLKDKRTVPRGCFGQANAKAAYVHLNTIALQQPSIKLGRANLASHLSSRQQLYISIYLPADSLAGPR
ncbi:hypothetical protein D3C72_1516880 [compost metagenome]